MPLYFMPTQFETDPRGRQREVSIYIDLLRPFGEAKLEFPGRHALIHSDCDAATDAIISADPNVIRIPDDLDLLISGADATALVVHLAANGLPASWVVEGLPWRWFVRRICAFYQSTQRHHARFHAPMFTKDTALGTKMSALKPADRLFLMTTMQSMGDVGGHNGATKQRFASVRANFKQTQTVEEVMTSLADAWGDEPMHLMGVAL